MSFRSSVVALPVLSLFTLLVACGGGIDSRSEQGIEGTSPGGSSGSSEPGNPGKGGSRGGLCTAAPSCEPGDTSVSGPPDCLQDDARCYQRELCGTSIWCTGTGTGNVQCAAYPSCQPGYIEVPACTTKDCVPETLCGSTIYCRPDAQCDGYPSCDPGDSKVPSSAQCVHGAACYPRSLCGTSIWCSGPLASDGGVPPG